MVGNEPNGLIAIYDAPSRAHAAIEALRQTGFDMRSVSIFGPGRSNSDLPPELDPRAQHVIEVAEYWAKWGGVVGAGVGAAVVAIPVIAAVVGLGPFALSFAAIPAATTAVGALAAAFVGAGVHESHALRYEEALQAGKIVIVAHTDERDRLEDARAALRVGAPEGLEAHGLRGQG